MGWARMLMLLSCLAASTAPCRADASAALDRDLLERALDRAGNLPRLRALVIARDGAIVAERSFRGPGLDTPVNIKSVSKSVISALVGIAIGRGELQGASQPIAPFFARYLAKGDPRLRKITIGHLLSMQSGLTRTSGADYGRWTRSRNWVAFVLTQPLIADPGGPMIYSTGNTHLLSAILTRATGRDTYLRPRPARETTRRAATAMAP